MGDDFKLPAGTVFPSESLDRPRRRSIDTPALKLDTSSISSGNTVNVNSFPPPPRGNAHTQPKINAKPPQALAVLEARPSSRNTNNGEITPVMRSIFPRIDPVSQPGNTSTLANTLPVASPRPAPYTPSLYSHPQSPPAAVIAADLWGTSKAPSKQYQRPSTHITEAKSSKLSTPEQLLDLWTIALGQESPEALPRYTLGLKCNSLEYNHESISLTSASTDFYAVKASGASLVVTRKHPLNSQAGVTIATLQCETPTVTSPTIAVLFPSIAENQAITSAKQIAIDNQLSEMDATMLQVNMVEDAKRAQAGTLLWDSDSSSYYFTLPNIEKQSQSEVAAPFQIEYTPGESIRFMDRSSQPLLTLNLADYTLVIETNRISSLTASPHVLDILLSGLLTLTLHLHRSHSVFSEPKIIAPYFAPPPRSVRGGKVISSPRPSTSKAKRSKVSPQSTAPWLSRLNPLATRKQSPQPSNSPYFLSYNKSTLTFDKDLERGSDVDSIIMPNHRIPPMTTPPIAPNGIAPELRGSNTGVDLSKFQAFDLEDPDLGGGTKAALRLLYWAFSVIVWILGVITGVLAAGIVAVGSCLGGGSGSREG